MRTRARRARAAARAARRGGPRARARWRGIAMLRHVSLLLPLTSCCLGLDNGLGLSGPAMGWSSCTFDQHGAEPPLHTPTLVAYMPPTLGAACASTVYRLQTG